MVKLFSLRAPLFVSTLLLFGSLGCQKSTKPTPPPPPELVHTVQFRGETPWLISEWYTGKGANWKEIFSSNDHLKSVLRAGDQVRIPLHMVTQENPLPETFVRKMNIGTGESTAAKTPEVASDPIHEEVSEPDTEAVEAEPSEHLALEDEQPAEESTELSFSEEDESEQSSSEQENEISESTPEESEYTAPAERPAASINRGEISEPSLLKASDDSQAEIDNSLRKLGDSDGLALRRTKPQEKRAVIDHLAIIDRILSPEEKAE